MTGRTELFGTTRVGSALSLFVPSFLSSSSSSLLSSSSSSLTIRKNRAPCLPVVTFVCRRSSLAFCFVICCRCHSPSSPSLPMPPSETFGRPAREREPSSSASSSSSLGRRSSKVETSSGEEITTAFAVFVVVVNRCCRRRYFCCCFCRCCRRLCCFQWFLARKTRRDAFDMSMTTIKKHL